MRKSIFWGIASVGLAVSLLIVLVSGVMYQRLIIDVIKEDIRQYGALMHQTLEERIDAGNFEYNDLALGGIRVTIIDKQGNVIFDSKSDVADMENHAKREEVAEALASGEGESMRTSLTTHQLSYFYAMRLSDGSIMRLSKQADAWQILVLRYLPFAVLAMVLILLYAFMVSSHISAAITRPLESMVESFALDRIDVPYRELEPFRTMILKQREQISQQMTELHRERDKLTNLMNNMNEGFLILDMEHRIVSINEAAISLLKARSGSYFYKHIETLTRDPEFFEALQHVYQGEHQTRIIDVDGRTIRFFMNTIEEHGVLSGVMIFLLDVSRQFKLDKMRREFTSNVSHELKTPLTSISGFAEMIHSDMIASLDDAKYFAGKIQQEAARLITMVNEVMRLSQIEEAREKEFEPIELTHIIGNVLEQLRFIAKQRNITICFDPVSIAMEANAQMMTELVFNLVDNAIRYSHPDTKIQVITKSDDNVLELRVKDQGIGIPKKYQERIFERFFTVDKSHSKQQGGTGLGLSIVKHIVEYHNGHIALESEEGSGTEFIVTLPLHQIN